VAHACVYDVSGLLATADETKEAGDVGRESMGTRSTGPGVTSNSERQSPSCSPHPAIWLNRVRVVRVDGSQRCSWLAPSQVRARSGVVVRRVLPATVGKGGGIRLPVSCVASKIFLWRLLFEGERARPSFRACDALLQHSAVVQSVRPQAFVFLDGRFCLNKNRQPVVESKSSVPSHFLGPRGFRGRAPISTLEDAPPCCAS